MLMEQERVVLKNEFATVEVSRDETANGSRLHIRDVQTGARCTWTRWSWKP